MNAELLAHPEFVEIDRHFASFIDGFGDGELPGIAAAMLSRNIRHGHICLDLVNGPARFDEPLPDFSSPKLQAWKESFAANRAIGGPDQGRPMVLDDAGRIYLRRYWEYEKELANAILMRCEDAAPSQKGVRDLQELAIKTALARRFVVISGGPGTGKTTTVLKILRRIVDKPGGEKLRIALAAPTGKAAARLQEALRSDVREDLFQGRLPKSASTLHRLLGPRHNSVYFRYHAKNPLPLDVVVVDEASMVPLTMMAKLVAALPMSARIILLGDHQQLASVEAGAVLGDIARAASQPGPLQGSLVVLEKNYRFGNESNIFALCNAIRDNQVDRALEILESKTYRDVSSLVTPAPPVLKKQLREPVMAGYAAYLRAGAPAEALTEFKKFRVLCALRSGPYGVKSLNQTIVEILREEKLIGSNQHSYPGMPVLITQNDYALQLFNGDIGILLPDSTDGSLLAWFNGEDGGLRHIPPARLPEHEPAFAMTVHKSQGSEFDQVLLILPDKESPVLTRELLYTGLTRARNRVELWFQERIFRAAVARSIQRSSGLCDRLSGP
jgi:exodeoxyribonuclease V alpha subunit